MSDQVFSSRVEALVHSLVHKPGAAHKAISLVKAARSCVLRGQTRATFMGVSLSLEELLDTAECLLSAFQFNNGNGITFDIEALREHPSLDGILGNFNAQGPLSPWLWSRLVDYNHLQFILKVNLMRGVSDTMLIPDSSYFYVDETKSCVHCSIHAGQGVTVIGHNLSSCPVKTPYAKIFGTEMTSREYRQFLRTIANLLQERDAVAEVMGVTS